MKNDILAVCDLEASYVLRLMEFIQSKQGISFEVQAFTSVKSLCEFAGKYEIALLLISSKAMSQEVSALPIDKIMILSEGEILEELAEYPCVYKYQATESLISEVMGYYASEKRSSPQTLLKRGMRYIAVYSPVKRALKTSFALALGQILARDKGVLYVNLESYSGFSWLLEKEYAGDISELMYFVKRGYGSLVYKLQGIVRSLDNLDYIPPALSPADIRSVTCEEWLALLGEIEAYSAYDTVILDLDEIVDGYFELLNQCDVIYMPVREDSVSVAKIRQYEGLLKISGYEGLMEKTRKLKLPFHNSFGTKEHYMGQLVWGELGDYVRGLIREEGIYGRDRGTVTSAAKETAEKYGTGKHHRGRSDSSEHR